MDYEHVFLYSVKHGYMQPCSGDFIHNNSGPIINDKNFDSIKEIDRKNNEVIYDSDKMIDDSNNNNSSEQNNDANVYFAISQMKELI